MMEDDIISDNILLVGSAEFGSGEGLGIRDEFPRGGRARGISQWTQNIMSQTKHVISSDEPRVVGSMTGNGIATDDVS